jgi:hypothetical protein
MRWCAERCLTGGRINKVMESIRGAVVDAFKRGEIGRNPFVHIAKAADIRRERGVNAGRTKEIRAAAPCTNISRPLYYPHAENTVCRRPAA